MKRVALILCLICLTVLVNSQPMSVPLVQGQLTSGNSFLNECPAIPIEDPEDNFQFKKGWGIFSTSHVNLAFKNRVMESMKYMEFDVDYVEILKGEFTGWSKIEYRFIPIMDDDTDYGTLFYNDEIWKFFLTTNNGTFYFGGIVL